MLKFLTGPVFHTPGESSSWNLFRISLGSGEKPNPQAVLAQERYEQSWVRLAFLLLGVPAYVASCLLLPEIGWYVGFAPALASTFLVLIPPIARTWELRGTALTIALAAHVYGEDLEEYENGKVRARMGYGMFKGWPESRIKAAFVKLRPWAKKNMGKWH